MGGQGAPFPAPLPVFVRGPLTNGLRQVTSEAEKNCVMILVGNKCNALRPEHVRGVPF